MTVDLIIKLQPIGSKQIYLDVYHEGKHSQTFHICDLICCERLQKSPFYLFIF